MLNYEIKQEFSAHIEQEQIQLLSPFERQLLQSYLHKDSRSEYRRRIEIMLLADLGMSQSEICHTLNCSNETARYWISMAKAGLAHQWNTVPIGRPKTVNEQYIKRLQDLVTHSPKEFGYSFDRWTAASLSKHLAKEFAIEISARHINRLLKKMGLSTRFKRSLKSEGRKNLKKIEGFDLVIGELNDNSKPNFCSFGPFNSIPRNFKDR